MSVRYDFTCQNGHDFVLWSDSARLCPTCGSEYLKRIFVDPPMVNSNKSKAVDRLVRNELEARGISNIQGGGHEGDREKITWKSTPEDLAAEKVNRQMPAVMNKQDGVMSAIQQSQTKWANLGVKGIIKSGIGKTPDAEITKGAILNAKNYPIKRERVYGDHPENYQVKRG